MERWVGKTAVVTGASAGIGASIALALANAGMAVVAGARSLDKLQELQKRVKGSGRVLCTRCDVGKQEDVTLLMEFAKTQTGGIDVLVNNAAIMPLGTLTECHRQITSIKDIEESFRVNVISAITASRLAASDMNRRNVPGHIIMINSICGHSIINLGFLKEMGAYSATKFSLTALAKLLRFELNFTKAPIRMSSISPGPVDTQMFRNIPNLPKDIPCLDPDDVAETVKYVLSVPQHVNISEIMVQITGELM